MQSGRDKNKHGARKLFQLCRQVERALSCAIPACSDPLVQQLDVVSVSPAPDGSRLSVLLVHQDDPSIEELAEIHQQLEAAAGWLRSEVGQAISRRRVPLLVYRVQRDNLLQ